MIHQDDSHGRRVLPQPLDLLEAHHRQQGVQNAEIRIQHPPEGEEGGDGCGSPGQEKERLHEASSLEVSIQEDRDEEGQRQLHVDADSNVDQCVDEGLAVIGVGEKSQEVLQADEAGGSIP